MFSQNGLLAFGLLSGLASAQYSINPNSVPLATRQNWCNSETTQCPLICLQYPNTTGAEVNTCDATALSYECLCSNGLTPNITEYSLTLPYYVCTEWGTQCVANCGSDNTCANACRVNHPCGAQNPVRVNTSTISTMSATGSASSSINTATQTFAAFGASGSSSSTKSASSASSYTNHYAHMGNRLGYMVLAGGIVGGMAFLL